MAVVNLIMVPVPHGSSVTGFSETDLTQVLNIAQAWIPQDGIIGSTTAITFFKVQDETMFLEWFFTIEPFGVGFGYAKDLTYQVVYSSIANSGSPTFPLSLRALPGFGVVPLLGATLVSPPQDQFGTFIDSSDFSDFSPLSIEFQWFQSANNGFVTNFTVSDVRLTYRLYMPTLVAVSPGGSDTNGGERVTITLSDPDGSGIDWANAVFCVEFKSGNLADTSTLIYIDPLHFSIKVPPALDGPEIVDVIINGDPTQTGLSANAAYSKHDGYEYFAQFSNPYTLSYDPITNKGSITSTKGDLLDVKKIILAPPNQDPLEIPFDSPYIFYYTPFLILFFFPFPLFLVPVFPPDSDPGDSVPVGVSIAGTEFFGVVPLGTLTVLFEDASGIYRLDTNQTHDELYFREGFTTDNKVIFIANLLGDDSETLVGDDFFASQPFPRKILSETALEETDNGDDDDNFLVIPVLRQVIVIRNVEIPSPYVRTAFFPT